MKAIEIIKSAIKELNVTKPSKNIKLATGHLQKAIVQININERQKKILEDRKKWEMKSE